MRSRVKTLEQMGKQIVQWQDDSSEDRRILLMARRQFLQASVPATPAVSWRDMLSYAALGAALSMAGVLIVMSPAANQGRAVEETQRLVESGEQSARIQFSDGSSLLLAPQSKVSLSIHEQDRTSVDIETGSLDAQITPGGDVRWFFGFGPFQVQVTGTRFVGQWQPSSQSFDLSLLEGSVLVNGCGLSSPTEVRAGQSIHVKCVDEKASLRWVVRDGKENPQPSERREKVGEEESIQPQRASSPSSKIAVEEVGEPDPISWQQLARKGDFREACQRVEVEGFDKAVQQSDPSTLLLLADTVQFCGQGERASRVLHHVRSKHGGSSAAATAAFKLGRIAFDQRGSPAAARPWFQIYLQEAPSGTFAREAMGRLLEAEQSAGDTERARRLAESYLERYPNGPHAPLARSIVAR